MLQVSHYTLVPVSFHFQGEGVDFDPIPDPSRNLEPPNHHQKNGIDNSASLNYCGIFQQIRVYELR